MSEFETLSNLIRPVAIKYGIKKMSLFGSRARGKATPNSDYDFLISKGRINSLILYIAFVNELEQLLGTHVDVVTDTSEDEAFITKIKRDEIVLYER